jgi:hypothetical protein
MDRVLVELLKPLGATGAILAGLILLGGLLIVFWQALAPLYLLLFGTPEQRAHQRVLLTTRGKARTRFIEVWLVIGLVLYLWLDSARG